MNSHHLLRLSSLFLLFFSSSFLSFSHFTSPSLLLPEHNSPEKIVHGEKLSGGVIEWNAAGARRSVAEGDASNGTVLVLAEARTHRIEPSWSWPSNWDYYTGGWNLNNIHYWRSLAFSAIIPLVLAVCWFVIFGVYLIILFIRNCLCCCLRGRWSKPYYSQCAFTTSLVFLVTFTLAALAGGGVLLHGEEQFHSSMVNATTYILSVADEILDHFRDLLHSLLSAKTIGIQQFTLPQDVQDKINSTQTYVDQFMEQIGNVTDVSPGAIRLSFNPLRIALFTVTAALMVLVCLGFLFSVCGCSCLIYSLVLFGWILVSGAFIMSAIFLVIHNVTADTCVAVGEWLQNPTAHSALEELILPIVNNGAGDQIMNATKTTVMMLNAGVNTAINVSNTDFPPNADPGLYFNQSGPPVPQLCSPYNDDLSPRQCAPGVVDFDSYAPEWKKYMCEVSSSGMCITEGRITPNGYEQMTSAANISAGLYRETPFVMSMLDTSFINATLFNITRHHCPGLTHNSRVTFAGFLTASAALMLSQIMWIVHTRFRSRRNFNKNMAF